MTGNRERASRYIVRAWLIREIPPGPQPCCTHGSRSDGVLKKKTREVASFQHEPGKKIWKCLKRRQTSRDKVSNARDQQQAQGRNPWI